MKKQTLDSMLYGAVMAAIITLIIMMLDIISIIFDDRYVLTGILWDNLVCLYLWLEGVFTLSTMYVVKVAELVYEEQA